MKSTRSRASRHATGRKSLRREVLSAQVEMTRAGMGAGAAVGESSGSAGDLVAGLLFLMFAPLLARFIRDATGDRQGDETSSGSPAPGVPLVGRAGFLVLALIAVRVRREAVTAVRLAERNDEIRCRAREFRVIDGPVRGPDSGWTPARSGSVRLVT